MSIKISRDNVFYEDNVFSKLLPEFLKKFKNLHKSRPDKYKISFREIWGLAIIVAFRKFREPEKNWIFIVDKDINDDGSVASYILKENSNQINYKEDVEQICLPSFYTRNNNETYNQYLIRFLKEKKLNKGDDYVLNKTLLIYNLVGSYDQFYWQDFIKDFFPSNQKSFLHVYFCAFQEMNESFIKYHLFSFTNQKHRQFLNGQFDLYIYYNGEYKFEIIQEIDLLK